LRDQKAALRQREEIVRDAGLDGSGRKQKPRLSFVGDIEEEDPVLAFEEAQQSATTQDLLIDGKVAVMRLVTYIARRRHRDSSDDLAVIGGVFVEIDDCEEIRCFPSLIARPYIKYGVSSLVITMVGLD